MLSYVSLRLQADKDNSGKLDMYEFQQVIRDLNIGAGHAVTDVALADDQHARGG